MEMRFFALFLVFFWYKKQIYGVFEKIFEKCKSPRGFCLSRWEQACLCSKVLSPYCVIKNENEFFALLLLAFIDILDY